MKYHVIFTNFTMILAHNIVVVALELINVITLLTLCIFPVSFESMDWK